MLHTSTDASSIRSIRSRSATPRRRSSNSPRPPPNSAAIQRAMSQLTPTASQELKTRPDPPNVSPAAVPSSLPQPVANVPGDNPMSSSSLDDTFNDATSIRPSRRKRRDSSSDEISLISEVSVDNHPMAVKRQQTERLAPILSGSSVESFRPMTSISPVPTDDTVSVLTDPYNAESVEIPASTSRKPSIASVRTNFSTQAFLSPNSAYGARSRKTNTFDRPTTTLKTDLPSTRSELLNHNLAVKELERHRSSPRERTYERSEYFGSSHKAILSILAFIFPPVAVCLALDGRHSGVIALNVLLTLCGWIPGVVHAI